MKLLQPLFALFASSTNTELIRMVEYLKTELRILRDKLPKRITVTDCERKRLVELDKLLGPAINGLVTIVSPRTFARWVSGEKKTVIVKKKVERGRTRKSQEVRELVVRLAKENAWGYTRILGELRKLGIHDVRRTTIANILKERGFDPAQERSEGTWHDFVKRHASTLWACDFFSRMSGRWVGSSSFTFCFSSISAREKYTSLE